MNDDSTNHEPAPDAYDSLPKLAPPEPAVDPNPYLASLVDLPPPPKPAYQGNLANDFATAGFMMLCNLIGAAVMVPFVMLFTKGNPQIEQFPWQFWLAAQLISYGILAALTIPVGVWLGSRVGLDAPIFRGLAKGDFSVLNPFRAGWVAASVSGIAAGTVIYFAGSAMPSDAMGKDVGGNAAVHAIQSAPPWVPLLASFGAGITEETWCRFGIMAFIVWFGCLVVWSNRPNTAYLWFANIVASIPFSAMHIGNLLAIGGEITPGSLVVIFSLNGLIGLTCGWLYSKYGIESAMASHTICDIVMKVVWPWLLPTVSSLAYHPAWISSTSLS